MSDSWSDWLQQKLYWYSACTNRQVYSNNPKRGYPKSCTFIHFESWWQLALRLLSRRCATL